MEAVRRSWVAMVLSAAMAWPAVAAACCDAAASAPAASAAKGKTSCQPAKPKGPVTTVVVEKPPPVVVVCGSATATAAPVISQTAGGTLSMARSPMRDGDRLTAADLKEVLSWGAAGAIAFFVLGILLLFLAVLQLMFGRSVELRSAGGGFGGRNLGWESSPTMALLVSGGVCFLLGVVLIGQVVMGASASHQQRGQGDDTKPAATEKSAPSGRG